MEINQFAHEITGVMPNANVVEGRFGILTTHTFDHNYGSQTDLMGFQVPATAEEAKFANQLITWQVDNQVYPMWTVPTAFTSAQRRGYSSTQDDPMTGQTIYLSNPAAQDGLTIASGTPSLAFGKGVYTLASGAYINDASWAVGSLVQVANSAEDGGATNAGKAKRLATHSDRKVGIVREYSSTTGRMTIEVD
jgi:hypothetical protein